MLSWINVPKLKAFKKKSAILDSKSFAIQESKSFAIQDSKNLKKTLLSRIAKLCYPG
jgi:uncharacterized protein YqcC (DUF446 family)